MKKESKPHVNNPLSFSLLLPPLSPSLSHRSILSAAAAGPTVASQAALVAAVGAGDAEKVRAALDGGAHPTLCRAASPSPLHLAVYLGLGDIVR